MPLNDRQIRNAKPAEKPYKLSDGGSLYLLIKPQGGKYWRLDYAFNDKRKTLALGTYPTTSLIEARGAREAAKKQIANGIDPAAEKQRGKREKAAALANTFERIAKQWHAEQLSRWKGNHAVRVMNHFEKDVFPLIGSHPIFDLRKKDIKAVIDNVLSRGVVETAHKIKHWISNVFDYAALFDLVESDPAARLQQVMVKRERTPMPSLPRGELTEFYRRLMLADAGQSNKIGIMLIMLLFPRNREMRGAEWAEIDWHARLWTIPKERMKMPRAHIIPLSDWALELLRELQGLTGGGRFLFPNRNRADSYISENTFGKIINNMGYKGIATPHGFRALASTIMNEHGFNPDAIERQLAHVEGNAVRAAYNRADYMEERAKMMQWYSDFLKERFRAAKESEPAEK